MRARAVWLRAVWLWPLLGGALPAQDQALELAQQLAVALAPERDDPDASVRALIAAALSARQSPAAALLASEARARDDEVVDPAALRQWLAQSLAAAPATGLCAQRLRELDWRLWRRGGGAAGGAPFPGYARAVQVVGPFGDDGSQWLDAPFPPDAAFPAAGRQLPGRFGPS